jgi:hypothetical protein
MVGGKERKKHRLRKGPVIIIGFFLLFWFVGISLGEPVRVLEQAVQVCLSCIGIG